MNTQQVPPQIVPQISWSMTPMKAITYIESLKYKRQHEIEAWVNPFSNFGYDFALKIACIKPVTDVETGVPQMLRTQWTFRVNQSTTYEDLKAYFFFTVLQQELHELSEWARTETGEHIVNPHPFDPSKTLLKKDIARTAQFVRATLNYTGKLSPDGYEV